MARQLPRETQTGQAAGQFFISPLSHPRLPHAHNHRNSAMPYTLSAPVQHELLVKKSRFLATVTPVADRNEAQALVQALRHAHPTAAHVCWALLAGGQHMALCVEVQSQPKVIQPRPAAGKAR